MQNMQRHPQYPRKWQKDYSRAMNSDAGNIKHLTDNECTW